MSTAEPPFRWRAVVVAILLPTLLFAIGQGAILPMIPVIATRMGADLATAGLVAAMLVIGGLAGNLPAGVLVARIGERRVMIIGAALAVVGAVGALLAQNPLVLGIAVFLIGVAGVAFTLARHAFMTTYVPMRSRARALSTLGGTFRLGFLIGPFLAAAVIGATNSPELTFWVLVAGAAGAVVVLIASGDPETELRTQQRRNAPESTDTIEVPITRGLFRTIAAQRRVLATVGLGASVISALRSARVVVVPLWAVSIGLDDTTTALIIGVAGGIDFALFYVGGWVMDRFGRLWIAVPSAVGLSLACLLLSVTHDLPAREIWFVGVTMLLAVANGVGAGILMTIGADLADRRNPAPFLGAWRFTTDTGGAAAPLLISAITAIASLSIAVAGIGLLGLVGALMMAIWLPRYAPRPK